MTELAKRRTWHLARLMEARKVKSPGDLARLAGLPYAAGRESIGAMLRKGSQPRDATLELISAALGVCPSVFHTPIPSG